MTEREAKFREKHEMLMRRFGRYPTRSEMCGAMGWNLRSSHCYRLAKQLGLELKVERKKKAAGPEPEPVQKTPAQIAKEKREQNVQTFANRSTPNMLRIMEIRNGDAYGEGKGWGHSPAEGYGVMDRKMITCPVCFTRKMIAPRMHPFWLRNKLGKVVFVCSRACTGQHMT